MKAVQQENVDTTTKKVPSEAEQIKFLKGQMPLKRLQVELQKLNMEFVEYKVREFEAVHKLQSIDASQKEAEAKQQEFMMENIIKHIITQEDIDMNPQIAEAGIQVGQEIGIPKEIYKDLNLSNKVEIEDNRTQEEVPVVESEKESPLSVVKD